MHETISIRMSSILFIKCGKYICSFAIRMKYLKRKNPPHAEGSEFYFKIYLFCLRVLNQLPVLRFGPSGLPILSMAQRKPIVLLAWSSSR